MPQSHTPPPKCAYLLTPLASTDVCHCVCISCKAEQKVHQEARDKSKAGGVLTEQEARYIARYCHMVTCCNPHVCMFTDTSCIE